MKRISANHALKLSFLFVVSIVLSCAHPAASRPIETNSAPTNKTTHAFANLDRNGALHLAQARRDSILALLAPKPDPYFGQHDPGPTCEAANRPAPVSKTDVADFRLELQLYASENRVYGLCNPKLDQLKSRVSWIYCSDRKTLFEVKEYFALSEPWKKEATDDCRSL